MFAQESGNRTAMVFGIVLIALGVLFLIAQTVRIDLGVPVWPFIVIITGVVIFGLSFTVGTEAGGGVASFGAMVTVAGCILLYQEWSGHYESWAYAWALVAPGAVGLGMLLHGTLSGNRRFASMGWPLLATGVAIFLVGALFFEGILGLGGFQVRGLTDWLLPLLLVGLGVLFVARSLFGRR